nr:GNAT family N-acetyltransferase [Methylacidimicrobium tartarophylax]
MNLRMATSEDIPVLVRLLEILFSQEEEFTPNGALQEQGLRAILSDPQIGEIMLAEEDGRPIGMVSLLYSVSTALGARVAILEDMVIDPARRGAGVGSALLARALQLCRERQCARVTLLTDARNAEARGFYEKFGFTQSTMIPLRLVLQGTSTP